MRCRGRDDQRHEDEETDRAGGRVADLLTALPRSPERDREDSVRILCARYRAPPWGADATRHITPSHRHQSREQHHEASAAAAERPPLCELFPHAQLRADGSARSEPLLRRLVAADRHLAPGLGSAVSWHGAAGFPSRNLVQQANDDARLPPSRYRKASKRPRSPSRDQNFARRSRVRAHWRTRDGPRLGEGLSRAEPTCVHSPRRSLSKKRGGASTPRGARLRAPSASASRTPQDGWRPQTSRRRSTCRRSRDPRWTVMRSPPRTRVAPRDRSPRACGCSIGFTPASCRL